MKQNTICHYGMLGELITDNRKNLNGKMIDKLCQQFKIKHWNLVPYHPQMNGSMEAANKNVKEILVKITNTYKNWYEFFPFVLCAYRTSIRTSTGATSYSLVYDMEAILPTEVEIPSLIILSLTKLSKAEWVRS